MKPIFVFLLFLTMTLQGQWVRNPYLDAGFYFKHASAGEQNATLLALPTIYSFSMNDQLSLDAITTPTLATSSEDNSSILRVSNTKFRASYVYKELLIGTFGLKLPTGTNQFTEEQTTSAGGIATRQLAFKNANIYNSLDVSAGISSCLAFKDIGPGDLSVGLGFSYLFKGPYTPKEVPDASFSPGNEFNTSIAAEYIFIAADRKITSLFDLGFTVYGSDELEDGPTIEAGLKVNWALFLATEVIDKLPASLRLANYKKGASTTDRDGQTTKGSDASDIVFTLKAAIPVEALVYQPFGSLSLASYEGEKSGIGDAFIATIGTGGSYRISEHLFTGAELGLDFGSMTGLELDDDNKPKMKDQSVFGIEVSGNLQYKF